MLNYTLDDLIKTAYELRASDIFIKAGSSCDAPAREDCPVRASP